MFSFLLSLHLCPSRKNVYNSKTPRDKNPDFCESVGDGPGHVYHEEKGGVIDVNLDLFKFKVKVLFTFLFRYLFLRPGARIREGPNGLWEKAPWAIPGYSFCLLIFSGRGTTWPRGFRFMWCSSVFFQRKNLRFGWKVRGTFSLKTAVEKCHLTDVIRAAHATL